MNSVLGAHILAILMHCTQKIPITALAKLGKSESDGDRILSKGELLQESHEIIAVTINIKINLSYYYQSTRICKNKNITIVRI